jgi:hypothetical protein
MPRARRTPRGHRAPTEQAHAARRTGALRCPDRRPYTAPDGDRAPTAGRATRHQVVARMTARRSGPRAPLVRATPPFKLAEPPPLRSADATSDSGTLTSWGSAANRPHQTHMNTNRRSVCQQQPGLAGDRCPTHAVPHVATAHPPSKPTPCFGLPQSGARIGDRIPNPISTHHRSRGRVTRHRVLVRATVRRSGPRAPRPRATSTFTLAELPPQRSADASSDSGTLTKMGSAAMRPRDPPPAHDTPVALSAATRVSQPGGLTR